ncbi:hypothetical protein, partial [Acetobacter sp.]|uniref:hypothetical protein n=1 Tax=Acetobacter sp. TaxID=440 RepID=UPI0039EA0742
RARKIHRQSNPSNPATKQLADAQQWFNFRNEKYMPQMHKAHVAFWHSVLMDCPFEPKSNTEDMKGPKAP